MNYLTKDNDNKKDSNNQNALKNRKMKSIVNSKINKHSTEFFNVKNTKSANILFKLIPLLIIIIIVFLNLNPLLIYASEEIYNNNSQELNFSLVENNVYNQIDTSSGIKIDNIINTGKDHLISTENQIIPSTYEYGINDNTQINEPLQGNLGICWAFSIMNVLESSIAKQLNINNTNFSRRHIDYISSNIDSSNPYKMGRRVGDGAVTIAQYHYAQNGAGIVSELNFPLHYDNKPLKYSDLDLPKEPYFMESLRHFNNILKVFENGQIKYKTNSVPDRYITQEEVNNIRNQMKLHIMNKGGLSAKVFAETGSKYYGNGKDTLFIHPSNTTLPINHSVTIIGWDDNYSKDNFEDPLNSSLKPTQNGAWIVTDSRGGLARGSTQDDARYYISYQDKHIEAAEPEGITSIIKLNTPRNQYTYDYWGANSEISLKNNNTVQLANVFTKKHDRTEIIKGISLDVTEPVTIDVIVIPEIPNNTDIKTFLINNKNKSVKTIRVEHPGIAYLNLSEITENVVITADASQKFAVILNVKSDKPDSISIPLFAKNNIGADPSVIARASTATFSTEQSFINAGQGFIDFNSTNGGLDVTGLSKEKRFVMNVYTEASEYVKANFDLNGGVGDIPVQLVAKGSKPKIPTEPTKNGYVFQGWSPDINLPITNKITYVAQWSQATGTNVYNVAFDLDGGKINQETSIPNQQIKEGGFIQDPGIPSKNGFTFTGWNPPLNTAITKNTIITAQWKPINLDYITVQYNLNGGNINGNAKIDDEIIQKGKLPPNPGTPQKQGYKFLGWNPSLLEAPQQNTVYAAQWIEENTDPGKVIAFFNINGGIGNIPPQTVDIGGYAKVPEPPTKSGFKFMGWTPDPSSTQLNKPTTFVAMWEREYAQVTFKFDPAPISDKIITIPYNTTVTVPEFEKEINGLVFKGWKEDITQTINSPSVTFNAIWEQKENVPKSTYKIRFFSDPGKLYKEFTLEKGELIPNFPRPQKEGYVFTGWDVDGLYIGVTKDIDTTAIWRKETASSSNNLYSANNQNQGNSNSSIYDYNSNRLSPYQQEQQNQRTITSTTNSRVQLEDLSNNTTQNNMNIKDENNPYAGKAKILPFLLLSVLVACYTGIKYFKLNKKNNNLFS